jgi:hypothetical protein
MKLDVTLNGVQVNYVVTKSLRESIKMCNTFDKDHKDAKEMKRCLQTVLNLYEQVTVEYVRSDET